MSLLETAASYCFAPLQNLPWAERALLVVRPDEYAALLLIRNQGRLEAYSTIYSEVRRRNAGKAYSLRILENLVTESDAILPDVLAQFGRYNYMQIHEYNYGPAIAMSAIEAVALIATWAKEAALHHRFADAGSNPIDLEYQLTSHVGHLLDDHMGLEVGLTRQRPVNISTSRAVRSVNLPQFLTLKPLRGLSSYNRLDQGYLNVDKLDNAQPS